MAINKRNLKKTFEIEDYSRYFAEDTEVCVFAADATITVTDTFVEDAAAGQVGDIQRHLAPVRFDASVQQWRIWSPGFAIEGFLIGASVYGAFGKGQNFGDSFGGHGRLQLFAAAEAQGVVMLAGEIDATAVPLVGGATQAQLNSALQSGLREDNIRVKNLEGVH